MLYKKAIMFDEENSDQRYAGKIFPLTFVVWSENQWKELDGCALPPEFSKENAILGPNGLQPIFGNLKDFGTILDIEFYGSVLGGRPNCPTLTIDGDYYTIENFPLVRWQEVEETPYSEEKRSDIEYILGD